MQFEDSAVQPDEGAVPRIDRAVILSALICAAICVIMMRTGFLSFLFLVPLGFCSVLYGPAAAWLGFIFAITGNGVLALGVSLRYAAGLANAGIDILYFSALCLGFTWIMANSPASIFPPVRTVYRFIIASVAGAFAFIGVIFPFGFAQQAAEDSFYTLIRSQIEAISSTYIASLGTDAAQQAFLERLLTPDRIIETFSLIIMRGGAIASAFFLFFISRQLAFGIARLRLRRIQRQNPGKVITNRSAARELIGFIAPRGTIIVLSLCLPLILLSRTTSLAIIELASWNILVICAIMFFAQGGGIVLFRLARRPMPIFMRLVCSLAFVFIMFSPGINVIAIAAVILLGIAETWLPLRKN